MPVDFFAGDNGSDSATIIFKSSVRQKTDATFTHRVAGASDQWEMITGV